MRPLLTVDAFAAALAILAVGCTESKSISTDVAADLKSAAPQTQTVGALPVATLTTPVVPITAPIAPPPTTPTTPTTPSDPAKASKTKTNTNAGSGSARNAGEKSCAANP